MPGIASSKRWALARVRQEARATGCPWGFRVREQRALLMGTSCIQGRNSHLEEQRKRRVGRGLGRTASTRLRQQRLDAQRRGQGMATGVWHACSLGRATDERPLAGRGIKGRKGREVRESPGAWGRWPRGRPAPRAPPGWGARKAGRGGGSTASSLGPLQLVPRRDDDAGARPGRDPVRGREARGDQLPAEHHPAAAGGGGGCRRQAVGCRPPHGTRASPGRAATQRGPGGCPPPPAPDSADKCSADLRLQPSLDHAEALVGNPAWRSRDPCRASGREGGAPPPGNWWPLAEHPLLAAQ